MGARGIVYRLGCMCAAVVVLVGCARGGSNAATNAHAPAINAATAAPPTAAANAAPSDLFDVNAVNAANAANTIDPAEATVLAEKNADCVDQLIKAQPFGESRKQIVDNVTKGCLPIATWALQSSTSSPRGIEATERAFVAGRAHDLIDAPTNSIPAAPAANAASGKGPTT